MISYNIFTLTTTNLKFTKFSIAKHIFIISALLFIFFEKKLSQATNCTIGKY